MSRRPLTLSPAWLGAAVVVGLMAGMLPWLLERQPLAALFLFGIGTGGLFLIGFWPLSGVAMLIITALLTRYRFDVGPVSIRPEHVAAVVVGLVGLSQWLVWRGRLRVPASVGLALAWWACNLVAAVFFAPVVRPVLQHAARIGACVVTLFLMVNLISDRRRWWQALWLFLGAGLAEAAFGVLARGLFPFGINLGVQVSWNFTEPIPYGTFQEGNLFGSHTATWTLTLLALGPGIPRSRRPLWLGGLLVLVVALYLSLSRAAWLTFFFGVLLVWIVWRPAAWHRLNRLLIGTLTAPFLMVLVLGMALLLPASWPLVNRLQSFLRLSEDPTFSARLQDWALAWNDWLQQPLLGWGPGSFYELHGLLRANPAWISNLTLRLLQETGVIGLAVFAAFVLTLLVPALKVAEQRAAPAEAAALRGLVIAYAVLIGLAYQSTDGIWLTASWVHAGLIAAGTRVLRDDR